MWTKLLIGVLGLTALIPIKLGLICLFSQTNALEFFVMQTLTPDSQKLLIVLGCFVLATVVIQVLALTWLFKGRTEGFSLSIFVGLINIGRGILMFFLLETQSSNDLRISVAPIVIGTIILILTIIASKKQKFA